MTVLCLDVFVQEGAFLAAWDCTLPLGHDGDYHQHGDAIFWPRAWTDPAHTNGSQ